MIILKFSNWYLSVISSYDDEVDKIVKCQRVSLTDICAVELGQMEIVPPHSALHQFFNKVCSQ